MARASLWLLIGGGLCLLAAVPSSTESVTSSPQPKSNTSLLSTTAPPQSSAATSGDTSTAPTSRTTGSTQASSTTAAPALSGTSGPASASSLPPSSASPNHTSSSAPPTTGSNETHWTEQPEPPNSTTASGSASTSGPGSGPALQTTEAAPSLQPPSLSQSPGLVAVICIFVTILVIAAGVVTVKLCRRREPAFKKLDEVPMGKMTEDSPFARYPPK
ncbi:putative LOC729966 homolog isoform X1 [Pelodiscus sinensis]|uniref:putative LOC729966 homolog isoform X1 n=1 Tax=Pelodiscus sinensis TaxID=13735 RepID=UPI003F6BB372